MTILKTIHCIQFRKHRISELAYWISIGVVIINDTQVAKKHVFSHDHVDMSPFVNNDLRLLNT